MKDYLFSFLIHWGPSHDSTCVLCSSCDFPRELRHNQLTSALLMRQVHWHTLGCCSNFAIVGPKLLFSYFCHKSVTTYRPRLVCRPWNVCSGCYLLLNPHSAWYPEVERRTYQRPYLWHHCLSSCTSQTGSSYRTITSCWISRLPISQTHPACLISPALTVIPAPTTSPGLLQGPPAFSFCCPDQFQSTLQNQATATSSKYI